MLTTTAQWLGRHWAPSRHLKLPKACLFVSKHTHTESPTRRSPRYRQPGFPRPSPRANVPLHYCPPCACCHCTLLPALRCHRRPRQSRPLIARETLATPRGPRPPDRKPCASALEPPTRCGLVQRLHVHIASSFVVRLGDPTFAPRQLPARGAVHHCILVCCSCVARIPAAQHAPSAAPVCLRGLLRSGARLLGPLHVSAASRASLWPCARLRRAILRDQHRVHLAPRRRVAHAPRRHVQPTVTPRQPGERVDAQPSYAGQRSARGFDLSSSPVPPNFDRKMARHLRSISSACSHVMYIVCR